MRMMFYSLLSVVLVLAGVAFVRFYRTRDPIMLAELVLVLALLLALGFGALIAEWVS
jgi:hypothetical protein